MKTVLLAGLALCAASATPIEISSYCQSVTFQGGSGGPATSLCPGLFSPYAAFLTGVSLTLSMSSSPPVTAFETSTTFSPMAPAGVTWSQNSAVVTFICAGNSQGCQVGGDQKLDAIGGVVGSNFLQGFNLSITSVLNSGSMAVLQPIAVVRYHYEVPPSFFLPEPSASSLLSIGLLGLLAAARVRRKRSSGLSGLASPGPSPPA